jgi:hypothetical protein
MTAGRSLPRTRDTAVAIAGALAEHGVQRITLRCPGRDDRELHTRTTDLPALLLESPAGTEIHVTSALVIATAECQLTLHWQHDDADAAALANSLDSAT